MGSIRYWVRTLLVLWILLVLSLPSNIHAGPDDGAAGVGTTGGRDTSSRDGGNASIMGFVLEKESKDPIEGATVRVIELGLSVRTGADGFYRFTNVPEGNYSMEVTADDRKDKAATISVGATGDTTSNFFLKKKDRVYGMEDFIGLSIALAVFLTILIVIIVLLVQRIKRVPKRKGKGERTSKGSLEEE